MTRRRQPIDRLPGLPDRAGDPRLCWPWPLADLELPVGEQACHSVPVFVTNHALSGLVIGRALEGRPVAAFVAGAGSHLVVDMIPHWGCDKEAEGSAERFLRAARRDGLLGLAVMAAGALAVDRRARPAVMAAMVGAVLLDIDKPLGHFLGINPFPRPVQRLHSWAQNESESGMANEAVFGVVFAAIDAVVAARSRGRPDQ